MPSKKLPLWNTLLLAIILLTSLAPVIVQNSSVYADIEGGWIEIERSGTNIRLLEQEIQTAMNAVSITASKIQQVVKHPVKYISGKILQNQQVTEYIGIIPYANMSVEAEAANIYLVEDDGRLGALMDHIMNLVGYDEADGGSLYPLGIFIKAARASSDRFPLLACHEYCHYLQQSELGFQRWFILYSGEIIVKTLLYGDTKTGYDTCSYEQEANAWAVAIQQVEPGSNPLMLTYLENNTYIGGYDHNF